MVADGVYVQAKARGRKFFLVRMLDGVKILTFGAHGCAMGQHGISLTA